MVKKTRKTSSKLRANHYVPDQQAKSFREGFESIVVAIVLAFLFRAFEAEAFVIPTGSMAPTLQGRHRDLECSSCGMHYRTGDSLSAPSQGEVAETVCPNCFYTEALQFDDENGRPEFTSSEIAHTGDRILVNKFAYERPFGDPERWDVIVFKYPNNAKQNYIKRLVGLPGETIRIYHGDVYVADGTALDWRIVRKPPKKLRYMLQQVHDSNDVSELVRQGFPTNWSAKGSGGSWVTDDFGKSFSCNAGETTEWIQYRQYSPDFDTWHMYGRGEVDPRPMLITDFYTYNTKNYQNSVSQGFNNRTFGWHWVGDLAIEANITIESETGLLRFDLVEAGRHHICSIDVSTGEATLSIDDGKVPFDDVAEGTLSGKTKINGAGSYQIRFANVDNELVLWVNERVCDFGQRATYSVDASGEIPKTVPGDGGDLAPLRIGADNLKVKVNRMRVLRDVYYIATNQSIHDPAVTDYKGFNERTSQALIRALEDPNRGADVFSRRREVTFSMGADQFFPLGDNSPMSKDARLWENDPWVHRDYLIGKAVLVYWPHPYHIHLPWTQDFTIPIFPNFKGMKLIH